MTTSAESIDRVIHPLFQVDKGGSTPTSALSLLIEPIEFLQAKQLNGRWHRTMPRFGTGSIKNPRKRFTCYAATFDGTIYAVAIWSKPAARALPNDGTCYELRRLAISPEAPRNTASRMLRVMAILMQRKFPAARTLCSSQDTKAHTGAIYRAAGWKPVGKPRKGKAEWNCKSRPRPAAQSDAPKQRWEKEIG